MDACSLQGFGEKHDLSVVWAYYRSETIRTMHIRQGNNYFWFGIGDITIISDTIKFCN